MANGGFTALPRLRGRGKHQIDYWRIIAWLGRPPGAFENHRYREDLFPTSRFRMPYDNLLDGFPCTGIDLKGARYRAAPQKRPALHWVAKGIK